MNALLPLLILADVITVGPLVYDGLPVPDAALRERVRPYSEVRSAVWSGWSLDDQGLVVLTRFGETNQAHYVAGPGAARTQLTFFAEPVGGVAWDEAAGDSGFYVSADKGGGEWYQIYWFDRKTGTTTLLTDGKSRNVGMAIPEGGGELYFVSTARNNTDLDLWKIEGHDPKTRTLVKELQGDWSALGLTPDRSRILLSNTISAVDERLHVLDLKTGDMKRLDAESPASVTGGIWSADGRSLIYATDLGQQKRALTRLDLDTGARTRIGPPIEDDVEGLTQSRDRRWLAFSTNRGGASDLWIAPWEHPEKAVKLPIPLGVVGGFGFDHAGERLAFSLSGTDSGGDVWVVDLGRRGPGIPVRWTFSETGGLDPTTFVGPRPISWTSFDGMEIPGWLYAREDGRKHPVIVAIHGGPEGQARPGFGSHFQLWIDQLGAAVITPNVRGSTGYGRDYLNADNGFKREDSVKDIGALLDWIAQQPNLDASRVAVTGGSYGGYMVLASLTHFGERLRCGAESVGISNFVTFLEHTEGYRRDLRRVEYGDERDPEMRAFLEAISPLNHVDEITVPLLVGQGANDPRVPASEARQIVDAVRAQGGEAGMLMAMDEGHGFRRRTNREAWLAVTTDFFGRCFQ